MEKTINLVDINTDWEEIKEMAKEFDLNVGGVKKEELIEAVNRKVLEYQGNDKPKWYEIHGCMYNAGDEVRILNGHLEGRRAIINKPSAKKFAVKGFLINEKTGEEQVTNIALNYDDIELISKANENTKNQDLEYIS